MEDCRATADGERISIWMGGEDEDAMAVIE
jgi:hypothetical protein